MAGNFTVLQPTDSKSLALKDLNLKKKFRCLNAENLGSVGQRAAKLLAVKVGGLNKKSAALPRPLSKQSAQI